MFGRKSRICLTIIFILCLLWCVGCNKVTKENYQKLGLGMDYSEVTNILGATSECNDSTLFKTCTWGSKEESIKATFVMDKLVYRTSKDLM